ncbi:hypothetical protein [Tropicimonas aquimaris]|uniref:Uncharacterized protein n=1 Tax=Tropicimonas aquimaris TaxID=914152 RepID=A0ABW3IL05_9RHOB
MHDIRKNHGDTADLRQRLERDGSDLAAYLARETGLPDLCVTVFTPYGWSGRRPCLCGIDVESDGRRGLATFSRAVLEAIGWDVYLGFDSADYHSFRSSGLSAHRRLAGCVRVRQVVRDFGLAMPG